MTVQDLAHEINDLLWKNDDIMDQEDLFEAQNLMGVLVETLDNCIILKDTKI